MSTGVQATAAIEPSYTSSGYKRGFEASTVTFSMSSGKRHQSDDVSVSVQKNDTDNDAMITKSVSCGASSQPDAFNLATEPNVSPSTDTHDEVSGEGSSCAGVLRDACSSAQDQSPANALPSTQSQTPVAGPISSDTTSTITLANIPVSASEADVFSLLSPFTSSATSRAPVRCAFNQSAGTVVVTMPDRSSAEKAAHYLSVHVPQIKGAPVTVASTDFASTRSVAAKISPDDPIPESRVLFVTITNMSRFPVDIDVLYRVFSRYGTVEKIVIFPKPSGRCQSLIQLSTIAEARTALSALNHRDIYDGCNTLQIDFSRLPELVVNANTSRSWDFLIAPAVSELHAPLHQQNYGVPPTAAAPPVGCIPSAPYAPPVRWPHGVMDMSMVPQQQVPPKMREGLFQDPPQQVLGSHSMYPNAALPPAEPLLRQLTPAVLEKLPPELQNTKILRQINPKQTNVIICYNLPAGDITAVKLFNLFSIYGVVERVKLLRGKESTALVQFSDPLFAALACHFLQGAPFFGIEGGLQIEMSRNFEVKLAPVNHTNSADAAEEAKRTGAFFPKDQRCSRDEVEKIVRGACRPTATLFISNIPNNFQEDALRELISTVGAVNKIKLKLPNGMGKKATAVAELASEKEAVAVICHLHNHRVGQCNLKFAFTKQILTN